MTEIIENVKVFAQRRLCSQGFDNTWTFFSKTAELKSRFHNDIEKGGKKGIGKKGIGKVACECLDIHLKSVVLITNWVNFL